MKPPPFRYEAPVALEECIALLGEHGDEAKPLAGGQSLVPLMNLRLAAPAMLVDLNRVAELSYVREVDGGVAIGAMTRHCEVADSPLVRERCPLLADAVALVGYPAIRNRGTLGGSLAHADPVAEIPCVALALDAVLVVAGPGGRREIAAADFFEGFLATALEPDELLVEARFPATAAAAFREFSRKSGDFAVAAAAVDVALSGGVVERARIALAGAADRPVRAREAEAALAGGPLDERSIAAAAALVPGELPPVMARRALEAIGGVT
ncbi:MAG TPA: FAD binding domain-containing protein [Solirubrobacter sp.]|nr:FAD binding domain-containing protein [Solirubrobacter sp.]